MIAIPAIDLRDGACVQLVGGSYSHERVRIDDPLEAAERWVEAGFRSLHVVDLDAATGTGGNAGIVMRLLAMEDVELQVGGGVRTSERIGELLDSGARFVVVGTRAIEDAEWLASIAASNPGRIVVAADVRVREIVTHGWTRGSGLDVGEYISGLAGLPLAGVLVTAVELEGQLAGADLSLMEELASISPVPIIASGGITTLDDLRALAIHGTHAAVLGMALYTGALDPRAVALEFAA
jgi:phosphoribosylformimino-5-aminoimidazole carboxamide ribotide isomerase